MTNKKEITCIICPKGCKITVDEDTSNNEGAKINKFKGNQCKRGEEYASCEFSNPERMLTTTVKIKGEQLIMLPVRSSKPIPKAKLLECMKALNNVEAVRPVLSGQVIVPGILGTGADIIASKDML